MVEVLEDLSNGGGRFELHVFETPTLAARNGRTPETVVATYIHNSLSAVGVDHTIRYGFPTLATVDFNDPTEMCGTLQPLADWLKNDASPDQVAKDSNLLINDADRNGCSWTPAIPLDPSSPGNVAVAPGRHIDANFQGVRTGTDAWSGNVYSCMHEVGHNMGFYPGQADPTKAGYDPPNSPSPAVRQYGYTFVDANGLWNKTPCIGRRDATRNLCGETIAPDPDPNEQDVLHLYYNDCVADEIIIMPEVGTQRVVSLATYPGSPTVGDRVDVSVTALNTSSSPATESWRVTVDGSRLGIVTIDMPAGGTGSGDLAWTPDTAGTHTIEAGTLSLDVDVQENIPPPTEGSVVVDGIALDGPPVVGDPSTVTIAVHNPGDTFASETLPLEVDGLTVSQFDVAVGAGLTGQSHTTWVPSTSGPATLTVGPVSISTEVQQSAPPAPPVGGIPLSQVATLVAGGLLFLLFFLGRPEEPTERYT